jgi:hypothetical protein
METPAGRSIYPDIVMLAASGHLVVVEVKLSVNSELRDRAVIAQIIDYSSSFAALSEEELRELFDSSGSSPTWGEFVERSFPDDRDSDELAAVLLKRIHSGQINLVIACDKIPAGLPAIVSGIASQSALGFDLDLVEVVPFVREVSEAAEIIFVPSPRLATEIVARTVVTVTHRQGDQIPSVKVTVASPEEIIDPNRRVARTWTPQEVEEAFASDGNPTVLSLLQFAKDNSAGGQFVAPGPKQNATFAFYLASAINGKAARQAILVCIRSYECVYLYLQKVRELTSENVWQDFFSRMETILGEKIEANRKELGIDYDLLSRKLTEIKDLLLWLKDSVRT